MLPFYLTATTSDATDGTRRDRSLMQSASTLSDGGNRGRLGARNTIPRLLLLLPVDEKNTHTDRYRGSDARLSCRLFIGHDESETTQGSKDGCT